MLKSLIRRRFGLLAATLAAALALTACAGPDLNRPQDTAREQKAIQSVLEVQALAWNQGDINAFMQGYWQSEQLQFASGDKVVYGWTATRDRYLRSYPDRAAMGTLSFSDLKIDLLGPEGAVVFGRWALARAGDTPHGVFTLTFRKIDGVWRITSDHTSAAP